MPHIPLIPYYTVKIKSNLTVEQALQAIASSTDSEFRWQSSNPFWGQVSQNKFNIMRYIKGRNSYLPFIKGTILAHNEGSEIEVVMTLQPGVLVIIGVLTVTFIIILMMMSTTGILVSLISAFLFYCIMYIFGFLLEQERANTLLKNIFRAK